MPSGQSPDRVSILSGNIPAPDPHPYEECFELDHIRVPRDPADIGQHRSGVVAENNVVLENSAIPIGAVRDALPAETVAKKAADFRPGQRGCDKRNSACRIDTGNTFKSNSNAGKFCRNVSEPIN
ncbi:hypothetical protein MesoLj113a_32720 [Mesorhizobium sp. 113-1-2]|nr:hypothetical protein MesoLj113a_32720 [Mesorhizobium sp. 113-1-2]